MIVLSPEKTPSRKDTAGSRADPMTSALCLRTSGPPMSGRVTKPDRTIGIQFLNTETKIQVHRMPYIKRFLIGLHISSIREATRRTAWRSYTTTCDKAVDVNSYFLLVGVGILNSRFDQVLSSVRVKYETQYILLEALARTPERIRVCESILLRK